MIIMAKGKVLNGGEVEGSRCVVTDGYPTYLGTLPRAVLAGRLTESQQHTGVVRVPRSPLFPLSRVDQPCPGGHNQTSSSCRP